MDLCAEMEKLYRSWKQFSVVPDGMLLKSVWGSDWDPLLDKDSEGKLVKRMGEVVDGQYQKYSVESGKYVREHFFGANDDLREMVKNFTDEQLRKMKRGGHDPEKGICRL